MGVSHFTLIVGLSLIFVLGFNPIFDFIDTTYGLATATVGFPLGSHDQAQWEKRGPYPNNRLGSLDTPMRFVNDDTVAHHIILGYGGGDTYDFEMPSGNSFDTIIEPGETFSFQFTYESKYDWKCQIHPWMTGDIQIGVWKPAFSDIELLGEESFPNHVVWSESRKLTKNDFIQSNPSSKTALADIDVDFDFKPNFEYTKHIPCEITIYSVDVIPLMDRTNSHWSQSRIDNGILSETHVLRHEQKHFDIGEVVARATEDIIHEKYVGKPIACVSPLNNEFKAIAFQQDQEAFRHNTQYDNEVYGGNPTLEQRLQNQANWNVRVDCFLEKRGFDSSCLSLTGTWTQADLNLYTKSGGSQTSTNNQPAAQPVPAPIPTTNKQIIDYYLEGFPGDVISRKSGDGKAPETNAGPIKTWRILGGEASSWISTKKLDFGLTYPGEESKEISWSVKIPENQKPGRYSFTWDTFCENYNTGKSCANNYTLKYYVDVKTPQNSIPTKTIKTPSVTSMGKNQVTIHENSFSPKNITIDVGESISWINTHSSWQIVRSEIITDGVSKTLFNSRQIKSGDYWSHTFSESGVYHYELMSSNPYFTGTVTVKESSNYSTDDIGFGQAIKNPQSSSEIVTNAPIEHKCPADTSDGNKVIWKANSLSRDGKHAEAIACFKKLIQNDPDWSDTANMGLAKSYNQIGEYDEAIKSVLKIDGYIGAPHVLNQLLGDAYLGKGEYKKAISEYDRILLQFSDNTAALEGKHKAEELLKAPKQEVKPNVKQETKNPKKVPDWVKNNAKWWSDNQIKDNDFIKGLEFLVKEEIITVPKQTPTSTSTSKEIPGWVKTQVEWWANGKITEEEFLNSVSYLMKQGIISLEDIKPTVQDDGFKTFTSDFGFSIDYPSDWYVDDESVVDSGYADIVWFLPEKGYYTNSVKVSVVYDDVKPHNLSTEKYAESITNLLEAQCNSVTIETDGYECENFKPLGSSLMTEFDVDWITIAYSTTETIPDGTSIDMFYGFSETQRDNDTFILGMSFSDDFIKNTDGFKYTEYTKKFFESFRIN